MMRIARNITACGLLSVLTLAAASCSPGGTGTVLLDQTTKCTPQFDAVGNLVACQVTLSFAPTSANQTIRVSVIASLTTSRPAFFVSDLNNNLVAQVPDPTINNPSATFESANTTVHIVLIDEGINADSEYRVLVEAF